MEDKQNPVLDGVGDLIYLRVEWKDALVLIEVRRHEDEKQVHLINYGLLLQSVRVILGRDSTGKIISKDHGDKVFNGVEVQLELDIYSVITLHKT